MTQSPSNEADKNLRVAVLGSGAWGTALACVSARNGYHTKLWGRNTKSLDEINTEHKNSKYLPDINLPKEIIASGNLNETLSDIDILLMVTPAQTIQSVSVTAVGRLLATSLAKLGPERAAIGLPFKC